MTQNSFSIVIPARLNSIRFKNKILHKIYNLPMIEHVRRRAELSLIPKKKIFVATNNQKITNIVQNFRGNVLKTKLRHDNGTSRVSEIINFISSSYIIILQGDEPLIRPNDINKIIKEIIKFPNYEVYNTTSNLTNKEYNDKSIVKCILNSKNEIIDCFRLNKNIKKNTKYKKIMGILIFKKKILKKYAHLKISYNEKKLSIEQLRFLDNNYKIKAIQLSKSTQSVNYLSDVKKVIKVLNNDTVQNKIYNRINKFNDYI